MRVRDSRARTIDILANFSPDGGDMLCVKRACWKSYRGVAKIVSSLSGRSSEFRNFFATSPRAPILANEKSLLQRIRGRSDLIWCPSNALKPGIYLTANSFRAPNGFTMIGLRSSAGLMNGNAIAFEGEYTGEDCRLTFSFDISKEFTMHGARA